MSARVCYSHMELIKTDYADKCKLELLFVLYTSKLLAYLSSAIEASSLAVTALKNVRFS